MIFFTADTHFFHIGIIDYCDRPFRTIWKMNSCLIDKWNERVGKDDTVYHLGDFSFGSEKDVAEIVGKLKGKIFLVPGSHDKIKKLDRLGINCFEPLVNISIKGQHIVLCHYAMRVWNKSHYGSWHLYGHSHGGLEPIGKSLDVGVDGHAFYPWSFDEIRKYMKDRPDNPYLVKSRVTQD